MSKLLRGQWRPLQGEKPPMTQSRRGVTIEEAAMAAAHRSA
jgi:hypothetical protein